MGIWIQTPLRALLAAVLASAACLPTNQKTAGEEHLGDFAFVANAVEDSCLSARFGSAITFPATLSRTQSIFFFSGNGGTVTGTIAGKTFSVSFVGAETLDRTCTVQREETFTGTLEADSVTGAYVTRVLPLPDANCAAAVFGPARQFAQLPCAVRYAVVGQRLDTPDGGAGDAGTPDGGGAEDGGTPDGGD